MARKLKVFRTPIGFHDAYVAAASQKDALTAWGTDANLFARGIAEVVTDPKLTKEALARPGEVIKVLRGSAKEHLAALPKEAIVKPSPRRSFSATAKSADASEPVAPEPTLKSPPKPKIPPKHKPKPTRERLAAAEQALADAERERRSVLDDLRRRERALQSEREQTEKRQSTEMVKLERAAERAASAYRSAVAKWRG